MYPGAFVENQPNQPAVIMSGTGESLTYAELDEEARRIARLFHDAGFRPGDHVAFCLENHIRFMPLAWGAHYAGLIYTAMSTRLTPDEMAYIIDNCEAKAFITSTYLQGQASELVNRMPKVTMRLMIDGTSDGYESYEAAVQASSSEVIEGRVAGTDMLYSSGTTGRPKGILPEMTNAPLEEAEHGVAGMLSLLMALDSSSVYLTPAPLYHAAPLRFSMGAQVLGATVIVMEHFDPQEFLACIEKRSVSHTQVVPTMFVRVLKLDEVVREAADLSSLKMVVHAAAPCPVPVKEQIINWWGPVVHEYYAGTEGNGFVYCNSDMWMAHKGTVGMPISCVVHIVGDDGEDVANVGDEGTIYFEGGGTFEYHGDEAKTAESRHPKGWSTLGDVGKLDEDGFLYLTDRKAYMIISGGVNIYPQEAENVLTVHPKVFDVAVIGVPNDDFGEEVKAIVQLADGVEPGPALERELIAYCREQLADVKCPRSVDFRDELPRHPTGKLYKRLLKDEYWAGHQSRII